MNKGKARVYAATVGLCATALLVDQVFLGDSGPASAEAAVLTGEESAAVADPIPTQPIPHIAFPPVSKDAVTDPPRDFFASLVDVVRDRVPVGAGESAEDGPLSYAAFESAATLEGVVVTSGGGMAVVDGTKMLPGDVLLGCELEKVFGRSAQFRCSDGIATLLIAPRSSKKRN